MIFSSYVAVDMCTVPSLEPKTALRAYSLDKQGQLPGQATLPQSSHGQWLLVEGWMAPFIPQIFCENPRFVTGVLNGSQT